MASNMPFHPFLKELLMSLDFCRYLCRFTRQHLRHRLGRAFYICLLGASLLLAACQVQTSPPTPVAEETGVPADTQSAGAVTEIDPYPLDQTTGPVRLQIPEIDLDVPVIAMGWRVDVVEGQRATVWDVPLEEAGWHINSAGAGALGNTIISGRQVGGAAVFAPLALGNVVPGQEVRLTDGDGITFVYRITEVTEPVAVTGATPDETAQAAEYFAPSDSARLTLVTGWPEFTTTHRIFAVGEFVGVIR
jgi:sortase (surface protein transpeptidase)